SGRGLGARPAVMCHPRPGHRAAERRGEPARGPRLRGGEVTMAEPHDNRREAERTDPVGTDSEATAGRADVGIRIRNDIIQGRIAPGTKLREVALAERYAVSRIPIREALRSLEAEGLVESRKYSGSIVAPSPVEDAEDLFEIRTVLEAATARRAAKRAAELRAELHTGDGPDEQWRALRREIDDILDAGDIVIGQERYEELAVRNMRFHFAVAELSGSLSFISLLRQISG